jgi:hypothetical protein
VVLRWSGPCAERGGQDGRAGDEGTSSFGQRCTTLLLARFVTRLGPVLETRFRFSGGVLGSLVSCVGQTSDGKSSGGESGMYNCTLTNTCRAGNLSDATQILARACFAIRGVAGREWKVPGRGQKGTGLAFGRQKGRPLWDLRGIARPFRSQEISHQATTSNRLRTDYRKEGTKRILSWGLQQSHHINIPL